MSFVIENGSKSGQRIFVLDPSTYEITMQATLGSYASIKHFGDAGGQGSSTSTGTFSASAYAPSAMTPAAMRRAGHRTT